MSDDFAQYMRSVAADLLGEPNARLSSETEQRYGKNGSLAVDLTEGLYFDHEANLGGGVLDLVSRQTGCDKVGAIDWMREHGHLEQRGTTASRGAGAYTTGPPTSTSNLNGSKRAAPLGVEIAAYDYLNEAGELLFQVVRFEPKTFRQRHRDETGRWKYTAKGIRQVPYRLPELIDGIANERTIVIVEGEKDVDKLFGLGITATCNSGGAGSWRPELNEHFRGATVAIVPDHDPQTKNQDGSLRHHADGSPMFAGLDHALSVAANLSGVAAHVKVVDLSLHWAAMPMKGDVSDWLEDGGGTADDLLSIADRTPDWTPAPFASRFGGQRWQDIGMGGLSAGYTWAIEDILPMSEISLIFGDSGSGKSFNAFDLAMCIARGIPFNGRNTEKGLVVYIAAEAGKGFGKRKLAYMIQHGLSGSPLPFYLMTKRPNFFTSDEDVVAIMDEIKQITALYTEPLICVVLDTLSALAPGMNENASQDVSMVRARLVRLQEDTHAAVVLVHHKPKGGATPRGHGSLTADFETTIEYETLVNKLTGRQYHKATVRKQREGKAGLNWSFSLPVITVGKNKWGNDETSCAVEAIENVDADSRSGFKMSDNDSLFMRAMFEALNECPVPPPPRCPFNIKKAVKQDDVRRFMKSYTIDSGGADDKANDNRFRGQFKRAGDRMRDGGIIGIQDGVLWVTGKPFAGSEVVAT